MKIKKNYLIDRIEYLFLYFFSFAIILFNPSKEFLGFLSITDLFICFSLIIFCISFLLKLNKANITSKIILLVMVTFFSTISLLVNEQEHFLYNIKYQLRWIFYITAFVIVYNYITERTLNYFKRGLFAATLFVCIYAILQTMFKRTMIPTIFWVHDFPDYINTTFRAIGTFDNPLNLCGFLVFPLGILQFTRNKTRKEKVLIILIYLSLIFTASKIAFIIIFISLLIYFRKYIKVIVYGSVSTIMILVFFLSLPKSVLNENYIYQRLNNQKSIDGSVNVRIHMLKSSLKMIEENPIFGIGYENFEENYYKIKDNDSPIKLTKTSFTSENFFLDFFLDNGLIPFIIITILLLESVLLFFNTTNDFLKQFTFPLLLFIIIGLIMSARTVPLLYLLFTFLAIISKIQLNAKKTINNYNKLL